MRRAGECCRATPGGGGGSLYLPYTSPIPPLYLPYISLRREEEEVRCPREQPHTSAASPRCLPYISQAEVRCPREQPVLCGDGACRHTFLHCAVPQLGMDLTRLLRLGCHSRS